MNVKEAILTRRSVRKYKSEPVKEDDLKIILEAARQAPSAGNKQPWEFIVIKDNNINVSEKFIYLDFCQNFQYKKKSIEKYLLFPQKIINFKFLYKGVLTSNNFGHGLSGSPLLDNQAQIIGLVTHGIYLKPPYNKEAKKFIKLIRNYRPDVDWDARKKIFMILVQPLKPIIAELKKTLNI